MKRREQSPEHSITKRGKKKTSRLIAERIDIDYFKRLHPFRKRKRLLSVGALALAAAALLIYALTGDSSLYSGGPLSAPHAFLEDNCRMCHPGAEFGCRKALQS